MLGVTAARLTVIAAAKPPGFWLCQCACGKQAVVRGAQIRNGQSRSCGCLLSDINMARGNGHKKRPEYNSWCSAKGRCYNPNNAKFPLYGARGIVVCDEWRHDFAAFLESMGRRPSQQHSLDRIDNDGPYSPGNCRWALAKEQSCNTRRTVLVDGVSLKDFAHSRGVDYKALHKRVTYKGQTPHDAAAQMGGG